MKKLLTTIGIATTSIIALTSPIFAAATPIGGIAPSYGAGSGTLIGTVISNIINIVIIVAVIAVLFMLVFGAFEWITSGGDKDAISKARGRILNALIGLVIIALAFLLFTVAGNIVGINIQNIQLPSLTGQ